MKKVLLWGIGGIVGVFLLLAAIGLWDKKNDPEGYKRRQQELAVKDDLEQKVIEEDPVERARHFAEMDKQERVEAILDEKDLTLCEVYHWIEEMEATSRRHIEAKSKLTVIDREKQLNAIRRQKWFDYCKQHAIPDSVDYLVNAYGMEACK